MTAIRSACRAGAWIAASSVLTLTLLSGPLGGLMPAAGVGLEVSDDSGTPPGALAQLPPCEGATPSPPTGIGGPPPGTVSVMIPELPGVNCSPAVPAVARGR